MGKKGKGAAPPTAPPETRTIFNRGEQYQAEMLTGNRAQKGNLPGGAFVAGWPWRRVNSEQRLNNVNSTNGC